MSKLDTYEKEILNAYEKGKLKSATPGKAGLAKFKAAATSTRLYASGRLQEKPSRPASRSSTGSKRRTGSPT